MKNQRLLLVSVSLLLFLTSMTVKGQENKSALNLQLGIAGSTQGTTIKTPAIYGSYEYFWYENLSVGAIIGYSTLSITTTEFNGGIREVEENTSNIILGGLVNYYLYNEDKIKAYGGFAVGYASGKTGKFLYELHAGGKYAITDSISLNAELGVGLSLLKVGVTFDL